MATKYFAQSTNAQITCDVSGVANGDLGSSAGSGTLVGSENSDSFVEAIVIDIDVSADSPATGNHDISVNITALDSDTSFRFRAQAIDDSGCGITASSAYSSTFTATGIKTLSATSLTWAGSDERLRISLEIIRTAGHGTKNITLTCDADSFINAPWSSSNTYDETGDGGGIVGGVAVELTLHIPAIGGGALAGGLADVTFNDIVEVAGGALAGGLATELTLHIPAIGGGALAGGLAVIGPDIALVSSVTKAGPVSGGTTDSIDTTGATLLVIVLSEFDGATQLTPSDSKSNTWTTLTTQDGNQTQCTIFYAKNPTVGTGHTFTYTAGTSFPVLSAYAFSGVDTVDPFDQENGNFTDTVSSDQPGSVTPTEDNELLITGLCTSGGTSSTSLDSGFTLEFTQTWVSGVNMGGHSGYKVQTTAGAENPTFSWTSAINTAVVIATFKASSSGNTFNETGSGGALAGGSATITFIDFVEVGGGAIAGGSATVEAIYNLTTSGGALAGGLVDHGMIFIPQVAGGSLAGGSAVVTLFDIVEVDGGALAGGLAASTFIDFVEGTGGALAGGIADVTLYDIVEVGGGALAGGIADVTLFDIVEVSGGVLAGGLAVIELITGGNQTYNEFGSGGILAGGSAIITLSDIVEVGGGALTGGDATENRITSFNGLGGAIVGGLVNQSITFIPQATGGAIAGGVADVDAIYALTTSGGILAGGISTTFTINNLSATGGVLIGSSATDLKINNPSVAGGALISGIVSESLIFIPVASGGVIAGGLAIELIASSVKDQVLFTAYIRQIEASTQSINQNPTSTSYIQRTKTITVER